mmetsp:Transcript_8760/g.25735  ORF Transcript_8760/g.25735 Transcript_8760/m.25735 type:complete len:256 (+) Transcript_8760:336-1103(+)
MASKRPPPWLPSSARATFTVAVAVSPWNVNQGLSAGVKRRTKVLYGRSPALGRLLTPPGEASVSPPSAGPPAAAICAASAPGSRQSASRAGRPTSASSCAAVRSTWWSARPSTLSGLCWALESTLSRSAAQARASSTPAARSISLSAGPSSAAAARWYCRHGNRIALRTAAAETASGASPSTSRRRMGHASAEAWSVKPGGMPSGSGRAAPAVAKSATVSCTLRPSPQRLWSSAFAPPTSPAASSSSASTSACLN